MHIDEDRRTDDRYVTVREFIDTAKELSRVATLLFNRNERLDGHDERFDDLASQVAGAIGDVNRVMLALMEIQTRDRFEDAARIQTLEDNRTNKAAAATTKGAHLSGMWQVAAGVVVFVLGILATLFATRPHVP